MSRPTILLSNIDMRALVTPADYLKAVESGFVAARKGRASSPHPMHIPVQHGGFHAKGAQLITERGYVALKLNGNLPGNPERTGLPTIQGALLLCDAETGAVLSVMDSIEITLRRTAAASALAAQHLARPDSRTLLICGCGQQAEPHVEAFMGVLPIRKVFAWDIDEGRASLFVKRIGDSLGVAVRAVSRLEDMSRDCDVIATCTTSRTAFLKAEHVSPGSFIAAVGADSASKSEITPELMERATVVVDSLDQCLAMGDLRLTIASSALSSTDVYGDLGELADGSKPGRTREDEITIFDSTGTAIEDVASAAMVYERALAAHRGLPFVLSRQVRAFRRDA
ncbi:MAG: ornithine cyclodeaminase family protein [Hyphomonadaceae bacterium]|nr:ornithine cyclodeaminase family protein [Hyphomonadaceae bacterium]